MRGTSGIERDLQPRKLKTFLRVSETLIFSSVFELEFRMHARVPFDFSQHNGSRPMLKRSAQAI